MNISRRDWMRYGAGWALLGGSASGWGPLVARALAQQPGRRRQGVLLWMAGGPSQADTFDLKPGSAQGLFKPIATESPGLEISEHLPRLARQSKHLALMRGMNTVEGDHGRGTFLMRTGYAPLGPLRYPPLGAGLAKQLADPDSAIPAYVSIAPYEVFSRAAFGSGFLGPQYGPVVVRSTAPTSDDGYAALRVDDLALVSEADQARAEARMRLWDQSQAAMLARRPHPVLRSHDTLVRRAWRMLSGGVAEAFALDDEPDSVRQAYGRGSFGQGCLLARRLLERGVAFVEVSLGSFANGEVGWDTHQQNFTVVERLSGELDAGWSTLLSELEERGLLPTTTLLWTGEFGRTPLVNNMAGRDHFPQAWTSVLAGGGIQGGQAYGQTNDDGTEVVAGQLSAGDLLATFCRALGVDPSLENLSEQGRPIRLAEGQPAGAVLAG